MVRMDMDWNLKKLAQLFQLLMIYLQKSVFVFPDEIRLVSSSYLYSSMRKRAIKWLQLIFDLKTAMS